MANGVHALVDDKFDKEADKLYGPVGDGGALFEWQELVDHGFEEPEEIIFVAVFATVPRWLWEVMLSGLDEQFVQLDGVLAVGRDTLLDLGEYSDNFLGNVLDCRQSRRHRDGRALNSTRSRPPLDVVARYARYTQDPRHWRIWSPWIFRVRRVSSCRRLRNHRPCPFSSSQPPCRSRSPR